MVGMTTPPAFSLRLLGGFSLERDTRPCKLLYEKGRALLAYLAMSPNRAHPRVALAALLWPDLAPDAALANLRQVLHDLRRVLNAPDSPHVVLQVEREFVHLHPALGLRIDAVVFSLPSHACPATPCAAHCDPCLARMKSLVDLYRGEFLAGFALPECREFEEWLQVQREALHLRALSLLGRLADCHEQTGAYATARPFALQFLELEPWSDQGLRRVIRLFALDGQKAAALAQYDSSCLALNRELGILFSEETHTLAQRIGRGELSAVTRRASDSPQAVALPLLAVQHRQVTVLYCELNCVAAEDPDEALALLREPQARCSEIIRSAAGYLVQIRGGSLLAYFGYPMASENAARMAVQAALAVTHTEFAGLETRASVHTGMVISGDLQVPDTIGITSGLTIRLRQLAEPAEVVISGATQRLVAGYFECKSLGPHQPTGSNRVQEVFKVVRSSGATSRLEAAATLTPLVGRQLELAFLMSQWQSVRRGARRLVLLRGEAGVGKSRLLLALKEKLRDEACVLRELRCHAEHSHSPLYPMSALFEQTLACGPDATAQTRFDRLAEFVETFYTGKVMDAVSLLATMLALPLRAPYQMPTASPHEQREKTLAILLERLHALARQQPVLLVVEDLHWADPSTLELLKRLAMQERAAPIFAVFTARPGFEPPWPEGLVDTLPLKALDAAQTTALVVAVAPDISTATLGRIVERADGIPLFAEELARSCGTASELAIPPTLQDLLMARLDRLGPAKTFAQRAASIGRHFSFDLLRQISAVDDEKLAHMLNRLQQSGLLRGTTISGLHFSHSLMRDAAYQSQTRLERETVHRNIAAALKACGADVRPELLAQHLSAGAEVRESIDYWIKAGQRATQSSANAEAIGHFNAGLQLLMTLSADQDRDRIEFRILVGMCPALYAAEGHGSEKATQANARIATLSGRLGDCPESFQAKWALDFNTIATIGYLGAPQAAQLLLLMANNAPLRQMAAHAMAAAAASWRGEFKSSHAHAEQIATLYRTGQRQLSWEQFGVDLFTFGMAYSMFSHGFLGFPDRALQVCEQMVARARALDHPHTLGQALAFAAMACCWSNRPEQALPLAAETIAISRQHGFFLWLITGQMVHGWARVMQGHQEGLVEVESAVAGMRVGVPGMSVLFLYALAVTHAHLKQYPQALETIAQAQADALSKGEHRFNAELHRLRGEALLGLSKTAAARAEACFQRALTLSRQQEAKSLELRAATSLAMLWHNQGKTHAARRLLEPVCQWFTEGFDTPDFQNASRLLETIANAHEETRV